MKMRKLTYIAFASLAALSACDDDYIDQFDIDESAVLTNVVSKEYTLTSDDYMSFASNKDVLEYATSLDPEGQTYVKALEELSANKYFSGILNPEQFLPYFVKTKWPEADLGSKFIIRYNVAREDNPVLTDVLSGEKHEYALTKSDYASVWEGSDIEYFTPATIGKLPQVLSEVATLSTAQAGDKAYVTFKYSAVEPVIIKDESDTTSSESKWTKLTTENMPAGSDWNYVTTTTDLSAYVGQKIRIALRYTSSSETAGTIEAINFNVGEPSTNNLDLLIYTPNGDATKYTLATKLPTSGNVLIAAKTASGEYIMPFGKIAGTKTYGYPSADSIAYAETYATEAIASNIVELAATSAGIGTTIKNADGKYLYMSGDYNSLNIAEEVPSEAPENGANFLFTWKGNGVIHITNAYNAKQLQYTSYKSFGAYAPNYTADYKSRHLCSASTDAPEGFSFVNISLADGLSFVWSATKNYGLKATAYYNKVANESESVVLSPEIDLSAATAPVLTLDIAANQFKGASVSDFFGIYVSTEYSDGDDVSFSTNKSLATSVSNQNAYYTFDGSKWTEYENAETEIVVVQEETYDALGKEYITTPSTTLPVLLSSQFPFAKNGEQAIVIYKNSKKEVDASLFDYADAQWQIAAEVSSSKTTFVVDSTGITANASTYLDAPMTGGDEGGFTTQNVSLTGGITYVWQNNSTYGWKASAFANKTNNVSESWLISPAIDLKEADKPVLSFEWAVNYLSSGNITDYISFNVSTDYTDDVTKATWVNINDKLDPENLPTGDNWTFYKSGDIDLSDFKGNNVVIAVKYTSTETAASTVEIKNVKVAESK